jgi:hypothetical protein
MTEAENTFNFLVRILRDRDVSYDHDALRSACGDPSNQTAIDGWVREFLSPETLLSKNEAILSVYL